MAFGQLSLATGNEEYAEIAKKTFDIILSKVDNPKGTGISCIQVRVT